MSIPLLIDTDVATGVWHEGRPRDVDDGFAIATALQASDIDLLGITTTFGNAPLADTTRVARALVACHTTPVPVHAGAAARLDPQASDPPDSNDAVEFMAAQLADRRLCIAAIGPLTNLGILAARHPERMGNIDRIVVVAGRSAGRTWFLHDVGPVRDFNFENDVRAAELILEAGVEVVMAGFELTSQVVLTKDALARIGERGSDLAEFLFSNSRDWMEHWRSRFPQDEGFHPWDSAAIAWLRRPHLFVADDRGWRIREIAPGRHWLETGASLPGEPRVRFLTGFADGAREAFVDEIVATAG